MFWNDGRRGNFNWLIKQGEEFPTEADGLKPGDQLLELGTSKVYVYYIDGNWYEL